VDVGSPALQPSDYQSALGVMSQVNDLLLRRRYRDFQAEADVLVRPDLGRHGSTDYSGFEDLVRKGYEAGRAAVPQIRERLAAAGVSDLQPRPAPPAGRPLQGAPIRAVVVRGNQRVDDALIKNTFNIPVGPGYDMRKGLRAFDKVSATGLLERTWLAFEPEGDGVRLALEVREAPANRAELALGYSEWEKARIAVRLRNQNTLGFGEQVELLLAASDAESVAALQLSGGRLLVNGLGYRVRGYAITDKPRFFDAEGDTINRATFERSGVELALRSDLRRWVGVEAGLRLGQVRTRQEAGIDLPQASDPVRVVFASAVYDTLDSLSWPEDGERLAAAGEWSPTGMGATFDYGRLEIEGRMARGLASRLTLQLDAHAGLSEGEVPVYDWYRLGGPVLVPGYAHEELKGARELSGALSFRWKALGEARLLLRAGAGNVWDHASDVRLAGVRYGFGIGAMLPTRVGPVSLELGLGNGGRTLLSFAAGWD
ncbi:MAG TPA: BamA/TamA family outer membrane protein, partial [Vicinamibacteria bacterium]|nr:BamA/TamA family outer membrane protein [Vicinamibacteria bacterium]